VLNCSFASLGPPAVSGWPPRAGSRRGWLVEGAPPGEIMAAQDPADLSDVVAGGPATEPRHRGRGVRAADDAHGVVVGARLAGGGHRPGAVLLTGQPHPGRADAERIAPAGRPGHDHGARWLAPVAGTAQPDAVRGHVAAPADARSRTVTTYISRRRAVFRRGVPRPRRHPAPGLPAAPCRGSPPRAARACRRCRP
jgi:hypothetical protein